MKSILLGWRSLGFQQAAGSPSIWVNFCLLVELRPSSSLSSLVVAQAIDRRATLGLFAAAAALAGAKPSEAAYGDQARVFAGKITNKSGEWGTQSCDKVELGRRCWRIATYRGLNSSFTQFSSFDLAITPPIYPTCLPTPAFGRRLRPLCRRGLRSAAPLQVEPLQGEGLRWRHPAL